MITLGNAGCAVVNDLFKSTENRVTVHSMAIVLIHDGHPSTWCILVDTNTPTEVVIPHLVVSLGDFSTVVTQQGALFCDTILTATFDTFPYVLDHVLGGGDLEANIKIAQPELYEARRSLDTLDTCDGSSSETFRSLEAIGNNPLSPRIEVHDILAANERYAVTRRLTESYDIVDPHQDWPILSPASKSTANDK